MRPRVLLIREAAQQMSSSGCCGRIEGDAIGWDRAGCIFPERRAEMERAGVIYRALRERFGESIDLQVIDPRNAISWLPMVLADLWRLRRSLRPLPAVLFKLKASGIIINGELAFTGLPEEADVVVAAVEHSVEGKGVNEAQPAADSARA